jgi:hypothetical protein
LYGAKLNGTVPGRNWLPSTWSELVNPLRKTDVMFDVEEPPQLVSPPPAPAPRAFAAASVQND